MIQKLVKRLDNSLKLIQRNEHAYQLVGGAFAVMFAIIGVYFLTASHAQTPYASTEAENGQVGGGAGLVNDVSASGGQAVKFAGSGVTACGISNVAFCDTFDAPAGVAGSRSGDLASVWGVSRATAADNPAQMIYNWAGVRLGTVNDSSSGSSLCGNLTPALPDQDVRICNGQLIESVNDNGGNNINNDGIGQTVLAMYPRQPFDFAGRTGNIVFDVSNNTQGIRASWPSFELTDQPVPAPYGLIPGVADNARNSVGFSFADVCGQFGCGGANNPSGVGTAGFSCIGIDSIYETVNYQLINLPVKEDGCVLPSTSLGSNNHVQVQISTSKISIYASDPGQPGSTRLIADATFPSQLAWSRGLAWMEDVHWNGDLNNNQQSNSFSWDNFGFDGPTLPRDLGFDVPDNTVSGPTTLNGLSSVNIGYRIPANGSLNVTIPNVTSLQAATGALLEFNYRPDGPQTITAVINGNTPVTFPWPFNPGPVPDDIYDSQTAAISVPVADFHTGNNTVTFTTSDTTSGVDIANIDLIGIGAGGVVNP